MNAHCNVLDTVSIKTPICFKLDFLYQRTVIVIALLLSSSILSAMPTLVLGYKNQCEALDMHLNSGPSNSFESEIYVDANFLDHMVTTIDGSLRPLFPKTRFARVIY